MKVRKLSQKECIEWILIYILFISHGSNILSFLKLTEVLSFAFVIFLLFIKFEYKITFEFYALFALLFVNYIITGFMSNAGVSEGFNFSGFFDMLSVVLAVMLLYKLDIDVMTKFIKIVYFFSGISLIFYIMISIGAGSILTKIFSVYNTGMGTVAGRLFFVYNLENPDRNAGIKYLHKLLVGHRRKVNIQHGLTQCHQLISALCEYLTEHFFLP